MDLICEFFKEMGTSSREECIAKIASGILSALEFDYGLAPPIRLSLVAERYLIERKPVFSKLLSDGEIQFDSRTGRFIITIAENSTNKNSERRGAHLRARFTYAHEFAHRFFFKKEDDRWSRVLELLTRTRAKLGAATVSRLITLEEELCNEIAGRLLVPDVLVLNRLQNSKEDIIGTFDNFLHGSVEEFDVSRQCFLIRFSKIIARHAAELPKGFTYFLISDAERNRFQERRPRFESSFLSASRHSNPRSGDIIEILGPEFRSFVCDALGKKENVGNIKVPLCFGRRDTPSLVLEGNWRRFSHGPEQKILIWGRCAKK